MKLYDNFMFQIFFHWVEVILRSKLSIKDSLQYVHTQKDKLVIAIRFHTSEGSDISIAILFHPCLHAQLMPSLIQFNCNLNASRAETSEAPFIAA